MQTLWLKNPECLRNPAVVELFKDAIESLPYAAPGGFDKCLDNIFAFVSQPDDFAAIAGVEDGEFVTLLVVNFNRWDQIFPYPIIRMFFNKGSKEVREAVKQRALDILLERGYTIAHTANGSGHSDAAWEKAVGKEEISLTPIQTIYEIRVK